MESVHLYQTTNLVKAFYFQECPIVLTGLEFYNFICGKHLIALFGFCVCRLPIRRQVYFSLRIRSAHNHITYARKMPKDGPNIFFNEKSKQDALLCQCCFLKAEALWNLSIWKSTNILLPQMISFK